MVNQMGARFLEHPVIRRFVIRFLAVFGIVQLSMRVLPLESFQKWLTQTVSAWMQIPFAGAYIPFEGGVFYVSPECTGLTSVGIFLALLLGFNVPSAKKKVMWGVGGGLGLLVLNVVRVGGVVSVGQTYGASAAEFVHILSWFLMTLVAVGMWYWLLAKEMKAESPVDLAEKLLH